MKAYIVLLAGLLVTFPDPASAQSVGHFDLESRSESRATIGVSIPFGGAETSRADMQPRVDFRMQRARHGWNDTDPNAPFQTFPQRHNVREARVSLTFEESPRLLLQGREADLDFDRAANADGSALGEAALWVGAALVVSAGMVIYLVEDVKDAGEDLIGPAD